MTSAIVDGVGTGGVPVASRKLGLGMLTALVIGSMVGSGVFSLPQNMAVGAAPLAIMIGWGISGGGILALALVYQAFPAAPSADPTSASPPPPVFSRPSPFTR